MDIRWAPDRNDPAVAALVRRSKQNASAVSMRSLFYIIGLIVVVLVLINLIG